MTTMTTTTTTTKHLFNYQCCIKYIEKYFNYKNTNYIWKCISSNLLHYFATSGWNTKHKILARFI